VGFFFPSPGLRDVDRVQNQNQFYFRVDVKTLKQLWAAIGDRKVAKPSCPALNLFRACTLNGIPLCNT
jgi:hypothetical protein